MWCECDLRVIGKTVHVRKFQEISASKYSLLAAEKFIPFPEGLFEALSDQNEWCTQNWGARWGICCGEIVDESIDGDEFSVTYRFESAYATPIPVIKAMGKEFPYLVFELRYFFADPKEGFHGLFQMKNGNIVFDERSKYFGQRGGWQRKLKKREGIVDGHHAN